MGTNGAALTNYDPLVDAVGTLRDNNENPTAAIYSPRTGRALAKLKDTTNQPLSVPSYLDGVARYETNQIPNTLTQGSSTLASDVFVGDWSQLYVGIRTQLQIQVLSER
jgi:HK97 family phage major capsid protein